MANAFTSMMVLRSARCTLDGFDSKCIAFYIRCVEGVRHTQTQQKKHCLKYVCVDGKRFLKLHACMPDALT